MTIQRFIDMRYGKALSSSFSNTQSSGQQRVLTDIHLKFAPEVYEQHPNMEDEIRQFIQEHFPEAYLHL